MRTSSIHTPFPEFQATRDFKATQTLSDALHRSVTHIPTVRLPLMGLSCKLSGKINSRASSQF